jgi:hypothetical protein
MDVRGTIKPPPQKKAYEICNLLDMSIFLYRPFYDRTEHENGRKKRYMSPLG